jgi:arylformamidase
MVIDLTRPMNRGLAIYAEEGYSDPPFECEEWCSVASRGFRVSALRLGTQTGTHIDAPAHFDPAGATLEALPVERLIGRYYMIDLPDRVGAAELGGMAARFAGESILLLRAPAGGAARVESAGLDALLRLPPRVWAVDGSVDVEERPALEFHRRLAAAGVYLIEDLLREAARSVAPGGEMIALPLALTGTSGAPCRVVVRGSSVAPT